MTEIAAEGLSIEVPTGWEGRVYRRAEAGQLQASNVAGPAAPEGERSFPVAHMATVPIPNDAADYGSDVVATLGPDDVFMVLKEFDPADTAYELFERQGMPRSLAPEDFDPAALQRQLPGQAGRQVFFQENGRAFCIYVVLGSFNRRTAVIPAVNQVLAGIQIEPGTSG